MKAQLEAIRKGALEAISATQAVADLESLRVKYLGKKGELTAVLRRGAPRHGPDGKRRPRPAGGGY